MSGAVKGMRGFSLKNDLQQPCLVTWRAIEKQKASFGAGDGQCVHSCQLAQPLI
jgi:hypothetical protein